MKKNPLLLFIISFLISCSNGKIEYEKTKDGCFRIPNLMFGYDDSIPLTDTAKINLNDLSDISEDSMEAMSSRKRAIEKESESAYLINTSTSDIIYFTIKATSNDSFKTTTTQIYKTNPGEKVYIGCNSYMNSDLKIIKRDYEIVGQVKK